MTAEDLYKLYVQRLGYPAEDVEFLLQNGEQVGASSAPDAYRPNRKPHRHAPWVGVYSGTGFCVRCGRHVVVSRDPVVREVQKRGPMALTDGVVAMRIRQQTRTPRDVAIPQWLIVLKRAQLKLRKAINDHEF